MTLPVEEKMIEIRLEMKPIERFEDDEGERCTVRFVGRVQAEAGLLGIHYDLSYQYLHDSLVCHLCKDPFTKLLIVHRVGFVPVGAVTTVITLSTQSNHTLALNLLKKVIDHMKQSIVHKRQQVI